MTALAESVRNSDKPAVQIVTLLAAVATFVVTPTVDDNIRGRDATPDYRRVFNQDTVNRLDLRINASDWNTVVTDMTEIAGAFGQGPAGAPGGSTVGGAPSQEAVAACTGKVEGDSCSFASGPETTMSGKCALTLMGPPLFCEPMAGGGEQPPGPGGIDQDPSELMPRNPTYVPVQVTFDGESFSHAGFRLKGNASLLGAWHQGKEKLLFRLNFDALEDRFPQSRDQTFFGFPNLTFQCGAQDNSYLRYKIIMDLFREAGVPAPQTAFVRVFLDRGAGPVYLGVYTMVEIPDRPMLDHFFATDDGNLYKPKGQGARWTVFDTASFPKRTNEADEDWTDIADAIAALNAPRTDEARWRFNLEARFNVDGFLRWLALNTIVGNFDAYGGLAHNYYLYGSPRHRDRLFWIPWDPELGLRGAPGGAMTPPGGGGGGGTGPSPGEDLFHDHVGRDWPLIRFLMDSPTYRAAYRRHVEDLMANVFVPSRVIARIQSEHARIAPYVIGSDGEDPNKGFAGPPLQFDNSVHGPGGLIDMVERRAADVRRKLESSR